LATRIALGLGASALAGCVPAAYVHDVPGTYYGGAGTYQSPPAYYYGAPRYYGYVPYSPRVVYVDHDHRGDDCRHDSHRRGDDRNDRNDQRHHRNPPPDGQAGPPAGRSRAQQVEDRAGPVKRSEERREVE
jgi:hypothetical protein